VQQQSRALQELKAPKFAAAAEPSSSDGALAVTGDSSIVSRASLARTQSSYSFRPTDSNSTLSSIRKSETPQYSPPIRPERTAQDSWSVSTYGSFLSGDTSLSLSLSLCVRRCCLGVASNHQGWSSFALCGSSVAGHAVMTKRQQSVPVRLLPLLGRPLDARANQQSTQRHRLLVMFQGLVYRLLTCRGGSGCLLGRWSHQPSIRRAMSRHRYKVHK